MYFECIINFVEEEIDEYGDESYKKKKYDYLIEAVNYTEAEAKATVKAEEIAPDEFEILPIKQLKVDDIYRSEKNEDAPWFKCNCIWYEVNDKGKRKGYKRVILVQSLTSQTAAEDAQKIMEEWSDTKDCEVPKVNQTNINEIRIDKYDKGEEEKDEV